MNDRNVRFTNDSINSFICIWIALVDPCLLAFLNLHKDSQWSGQNWVPIFTSFFLSIHQTSWSIKLCDLFKSSRHSCDLCCFDYFFLLLWFLMLFGYTIAHSWPYWFSLSSVPFSLYNDLLFLFYFYFWQASLTDEFILTSEWFLLNNLNFRTSSWFWSF